MRGIDKNGFSRLRMNPTVFPAAARKNKLIDLTVFDNAQLQIAIEWRSRYWLPVGHNLPLCMKRPAAL